MTKVQFILAAARAFVRVKQGKCFWKKNDKNPELLLRGIFPRVATHAETHHSIA